MLSPEFFTIKWYAPSESVNVLLPEVELTITFGTTYSFEESYTLPEISI